MRSGPDSKPNVRDPAVNRMGLEEEAVVTVRQIFLCYGPGTKISRRNGAPTGKK